MPLSSKLHSTVLGSNLMSSQRFLLNIIILCGEGFLLLDANSQNFGFWGACTYVWYYIPETFPYARFCACNKNQYCNFDVVSTATVLCIQCRCHCLMYVDHVTQVWRWSCSVSSSCCFVTTPPTAAWLNCSPGVTSTPTLFRHDNRYVISYMAYNLLVMLP